MTRHVRRTGPAPTTDAPVRQGSLRAHNLALVFRQIVAADGRPISRIELAHQTGLTRPTISRIVDELLAGRLVTEAGPAPYGGAGRPRVGLVLSRQGPAGLGLDIRADCLAACVVDLTGTVRHLAFVPNPGLDRPADDVLADLAAMAWSAIRAATIENLTVVGATLAVPGAVQANTLVRFAPPLGWRDVDVGALLGHGIGATASARPVRTPPGAAASTAVLPVTVENEANLAALGELYAGGEELTDFAYVSGALGLGAGIVLDGRLLRGARGWSGELGHVTVFPDGAPCPCGARGCLQAYAGIEAILATAGGPPGGSPVADALALADAGSPETLAALDRAGTALGIALAGLVNLVDVGTILLGGSYSVLASWLTDRIRTELSQRALSTRWAPVEVRPALLGPDAAVIGGALTSIDRVRHNPSSWLLHRAAADDRNAGRPRTGVVAG
ncbi:ROK family protein [Plantactinospora soyae]|uniref:NBD/HSP70 family sugar kinase n=1 Tax=Plantactinospora soyae TaxID=1544732 RepID=A0A927MBJ8_9ACTN|nr:ROK family protein [Plantactinospora soyae]MBE1491718.1 putative NBD/HSP70 family sugar kinase [Plantactinospora soyae]